MKMKNTKFGIIVTPGREGGREGGSTGEGEGDEMGIPRSYQV